MKFCFYPNHEYACPHISRCPHLGGASLGTLVLAASDHDDHFRMVYGQLDFERESNRKLLAENERLRSELAQARLELKLERQRKFACGRDGKHETSDSPPPNGDKDKASRKRGAPVGHPGWFRPTPTEYDHLILVAAPVKCPHCEGEVRSFPNHAPHDH
ncbi:MAG TPA: hypothetical protein VFI31_28000, partial [Pirellulales bacterium]|nr:hypothetical protein [Pirellulales bacterium]